MKPHYTDYARHCMRLYINNPYPRTGTDIEKSNWMACAQALKNFTGPKQKILVMVYKEEGATMQEKIENYCSHHRNRPQTIWSLVGMFEKQIAKERQLL